MPEDDFFDDEDAQVSSYQSSLHHNNVEQTDFAIGKPKYGGYCVIVGENEVVDEPDDARYVAAAKNLVRNRLLN